VIGGDGEDKKEMVKTRKKRMKSQKVRLSSRDWRRW
jgi:hypothetical protein